MRARLATAVLAATSICLVGLAGELALRLLASGAPSPGENAGRATRHGLMRPDFAAGWLPRANFSDERIAPDGKAFLLSINSTGQRGPETTSSDSSARRLLFLGDSFTMATQVADESTFVIGVERLLAHRGPLTAICGGVDGYSTYQELVYYRYHGRPLEPVSWF